MMGNSRRTFEVIADVDDARNDLSKYGNNDDKRDMARMGKIQEMRVSRRSGCRAKFAIMLMLLMIEKLQVTHRIWLQRHPDVLVGIAFEVFLALKFRIPMTRG